MVLIHNSNTTTAPIDYRIARKRFVTIVIECILSQSRCLPAVSACLRVSGSISNSVALRCAHTSSQSQCNHLILFCHNKSLSLLQCFIAHITSAHFKLAYLSGFRCAFRPLSMPCRLPWHSITSISYSFLLAAGFLLQMKTHRLSHRMLFRIARAFFRSKVDSSKQYYRHGLRCLCFEGT